MMELYVCTDHAGHWPVGVASVVVAHSEHEARGLLMAALHDRGLNENEPFTLQCFTIDEPKAIVLNDGNY